MNATRINVCLIGSGFSTRTLTEEIEALLATLNLEYVITEGQVDSSCDRVIHFVFDDERSSRLEELLALKQDCFRDCFLGASSSNSKRSEKSNPSFLGKDYPVSEKDFIYIVRYFALDYHNKGPPNLKRPLSMQNPGGRFWFKIIPKTEVSTSNQLQSVQQ